MTEKITYYSLSEVINDILSTLSRDYTEKVKKMSLLEFTTNEHFNLGLMIRNRYFYQNPASEKLIESLGELVEDSRLLDGDEFSNIILEAVYQVITTGTWGRNK